MIKAILYDLDGVLVDACEIHYNSLNKALMHVCGFRLSRREHESTFNGLPTTMKLNMLEAQGRIEADLFESISSIKQGYTWEELDRLKHDPVKIELHQETKDRGYILGCVTNAITASAHKMLLNTGQRKFMDIVISNEDIDHPKPNSEGYITAMVRLHVEPHEVLIVEDSETGLQSARATGAHVLEVPGTSHVTWNKIREMLL